MKTMRLKVLFVLTLLAIFSMLLFARGESWTNYPFAQYPNLVQSDWTWLVGSVANKTNRQVSMSMFLQLTKTNAQAGMQPASTLLDEWSDIDPTTKQDHSVNLDLWSGHLPSEYQPLLGYTPATTNFATLLVPGLILPDGVTLVIDPVTHKLSAVATGTGDFVGPNGATSGHVVVFGSGTGKLGADGGHALSEYLLLTQIASGSQNGVLSSSDWTTFNNKQAGSANLSLWAGFTPTGYTNNLYSLFQPALGFTPLTFQQTSNLILTLTIPLDLLATNGQVSIFGIDSNTNPVPIHLRNNLSLTANGVGGYDMDASGSGGSATPITFTNLYGRDTNALIIDPVKAQTFSLGMLTNNILVISNTVKMTNLFTHDLEVNLHQWTNGGAKLLALRNLTGNLTTNGTWTQTTNGNVTDKLVLRFADGTYTNLVLTAITNCSTYTDTNSLLAGGGGGGGGGGWARIATVTGGSPDGNGFTTSAMNGTGASMIVIARAFANSTPAAPTDSQGNTYVLASLGDTGDSVPGADTQIAIYYCASPSTSSSMTFTSPGSFTYSSMIVQAFSGGAGGILDQTNSTGTANNVSPMTTGSITPTTSNQLIIAAAVHRSQAASAIDSGFATLLTVPLVGDQNVDNAASYLVQGAAAAINPGFTMPTTGDFAATTISSFK